MRRHDRLAWLAACHGVLQHCRIRSLDEYRRTPPDRFKDLHRSRSTIRELVAQAHPDVLLALWPPPSIAWEVARLSCRPADRLLSVSRGSPGRVDAPLLSLVYCVNDGGHDERRAWRALKAALRGGDTSSR